MCSVSFRYEFSWHLFLSRKVHCNEGFHVLASGNTQIFSKHYRCISYCHHNHKRPSSQSWQYPERVRRLHLLLHLVFSCKMLPWGQNVLSGFPVLSPYGLHDWSEGCLEIIEWWRAVAFWFSRVLLPWHRRANIILLEHSTSRAKALFKFNFSYRWKCSPQSLIPGMLYKNADWPTVPIGWVPT